MDLREFIAFGDFGRLIFYNGNISLLVYCAPFLMSELGVGYVTVHGYFVIAINGVSNTT